MRNSDGSVFGGGYHENFGETERNRNVIKVYSLFDSARSHTISTLASIPLASIPKRKENARTSGGAAKNRSLIFDEEEHLPSISKMGSCQSEASSCCR